MADRALKRKKSARASTSRSYKAHLFRSLGCKIFYDSFPQNPKFVKERPLCLAQGDFEDIQENIRSRGWENFVTYPKNASKALALEFFANVYPKSEVDGSIEFPHSTSYVRGCVIPFDANTINELFGITPVPIPNCGFKARLRRNAKVNADCASEILAALCRPGTDWQRNESGGPQKILTKYLTPAARGWAALILHTISPCSNQTELNIKRATLAASIVLGEPINLGCILANEIREFAESETIKKQWWRHASLIALLCEKAGIIAEADEEVISPGAAITGGWIRTNSIPIQEQEPQEEQAATEGPTFNFDDFQAQPTMADFQRLEARMDVLVLDQQRMAEEMEWIAEEHRTGMRAIYRAICASQRGVQLDPDADIFQAHSQRSGRDGHGK